MNRKLVQMGKNCLMAAIPKKWLDQQGLVKGDRIEFETVENYLLVSGKPLPKEKEISLRLIRTSKIGVARTLQLMYDAGYKKISMEYKDPKTVNYIMIATSLLEQWKIKNISDNKCIESIEPEEIDFQKYFRMTFLLLKEFIDEYGLVLTDKSNELIESLRIKYKLILIRTMNIKRMINTSSLPLEYKYYYFIAIQFEEIADQYEYLLRNLEKTQVPLELTHLQKKLQKLFDDVYHNFYKFDIEKLMELTSEPIWKLFETRKYPLLVYHLRAVSERIKNIAKYSVGIRLR